MRDSPEDDGLVELQETARLRDRMSRKDRDRDRERVRDRDRSGKSKRRRGDKFINASNREDGEEDSSEESVNDEDEEDPDDGPARYIPPNPASLSSVTSSLTNHRRNYPPAAKVLLPPPTWKAADEVIGVSVPRKARSASTKRSHECWTTAGGTGEQFHIQASSSPVSLTMQSAPPVASPSPVPMSPSSPNASLKKKIKPDGPKQRPPKSSSKSSSSIQEEIEIEVAEVLYGLMRQSQGPSKQEVTSNDSPEVDFRGTNKSSSDSKSRVTSPVSNSPSVLPQTYSVLPQNSISSTPPLCEVAPTRKRQPAIYHDENPRVFVARCNPFSPVPKIEADSAPKRDGPPPSFQKNSVLAVENGGVLNDLMNLHGTPVALGPQSEQAKPEHGSIQADAKPLVVESASRDGVTVKVEDAQSTSLMESADNLGCSSNTKSFGVVDKENHRDDKFDIDLMAPPQFRLSPGRLGEMNYGGAEDAQKSMVADEKAVSGPSPKPTEDKAVKGDDKLNAEDVEQTTVKPIAEVADSDKLNLNRDNNNDLQHDVVKGGTRLGVDDSKLNHQLPKTTSRDDLNPDKTAQSISLKLQMSVAAAGWPGGPPPMGYVAPLQGVVSMDGSSMAVPAIQRKRCVTHCYIAKNIQCHQQFMKVNSFWPAAAASMPSFGAKPNNLNVAPSADMHGNVAGRNINRLQDKEQPHVFCSGIPVVKDKGSLDANSVDGTQKKQFLLQQSLPPGAPSNILHGPAFIFPFGHQAAAAASASGHPVSMKSAATTGSAASTSMASSAPLTISTAETAAVSPGMSFNFPNMPANETQYLAILGNSPYPFPIPSHVGAAPPYRESHAQAMPFFNGSFYSSQMLHPSQLQQQHLPHCQSLQLQQGYQNTGISTAASSSQRHLQNQQQRPKGSVPNGGSTNPSLQMLPAPKNRASQPAQHEIGCADSPSTADSHASRSSMSVYGQNIALPFHPSNFSLLTPTATLGGGTASVNQGEKKQQQQQQQHQRHQATKSGIESLTPPAFAVSFASISGTAPGLDISTMGRNHAVLQSLPEAARNNCQRMTAAAAAQSAQQKKKYRPSEDGKAGGVDSSSVEGERKAMALRASASFGQSITFARSDLSDTSIAAAITGNNVVDSSARSLNLVPGTVRVPRSSVSNAISNSTAANFQQQQTIELQKQQQFAASRSKTTATSNGSVFGDHVSKSSAVASKFPTSLPGYTPPLVQNSINPAQSPPWMSSLRPTTSQASSPSAATTTSAAMKSHPQQQSRPQQGQTTQISFGANPKSSTVSQGHQAPSSHQAPSPPMMVGSLSTSSVSKSAGGSPRTTSTVNKAGQSSTLSSQQRKNSPSASSQKPSPVVGRNVPSILGSPHITASQSQQQLQPQLSKQSIHHAQIFFSHPYMQAQAPHSANASSAASAASGYHLQRHRSEVPPLQQPQGHALTASSGMMPLLTPASLVSTTISDPAKTVTAAATAASSAKGGPPLQGISHPDQFPVQSSANIHHIVPSGLPYVQAVPSVQLKPADQNKQANKKEK
ncbi:hypothetical protein Nepgr_020665 [Nepenthes gracilis]|uniref:Protein TIME FOR COFFEE-like n=1 Tax=Nepenthes gracilis TaxID=150966 RepID=A0AAD3XWA6_NEPGR|nr:hypothetical protein Nepgr_020665 [Nepenthes gracilis]